VKADAELRIRAKRLPKTSGAALWAGYLVGVITLLLLPAGACAARTAATAERLIMTTGTKTVPTIATLSAIASCCPAWS